MIRNYDKLIFELSKEGRTGYSLPKNELSQYSLAALPQALQRSSAPELPEVTEFDVVRHYTNLSNKNFGVDTGFYPLGSCTMKLNPAAAMLPITFPGFMAVHPLAPENQVMGYKQILKELEDLLSIITGMAGCCLQPTSGAAGE